MPSPPTDPPPSDRAAITLREFFQMQLDDMLHMLDERHTTSERAISKAESATEHRFAAMNEFRQTLSDQTSTFLRRTEYQPAHQVLIESLNAINERITAVELRLTSRLDLTQGNVSGGRAAAGNTRANISIIIAAASLTVAAIVAVLIVLRSGG